MSRSSARRARTAASSSAPDGPAGAAAARRQRARRSYAAVSRSSVHVRSAAVVRRRSAPAGPPSGRPRRRAAGTRRPGCPWTWTSSRRPGRSCRRARSAGRTAPAPVSRSACAAEHSWCGKSRSLPPPCTSIRVAEQVERDHRALDVPAGAAGAEVAAGPGRLALAGAAPQQRVERVALAGPVRVAAALGGQTPASARGSGSTRSRSGAPRRCRSRRRRCRRRAGTRRRRSSSAATLSAIVRDRLDRADVVRRRDDPQRLHVLAEQRGLAHRQDDPVLAVAGGPLQQRVVDVGDVLHVAHRRGRRRATPGCTRSKVIMVAAWPRWVASYGVMPQTYMRRRVGRRRVGCDALPRRVVQRQRLAPLPGSRGTSCPGQDPWRSA